MKNAVKSLYVLILNGLLWAIFLFQSCAPVTHVKPLKAKQMAVSASLGGPLIKFSGLVIPVPMTNLGFAYGLTNKTTLTSNLGTTSLAFGVGQVDFGILREIVSSENKSKIGVSGFAKTHLFLDKWKSQFRWYPELGINAFKEFKEGKNMVYAGASTWFETKFPTESSTSKNVWMPMFHIGFQKRTEKWNFNYEVKWIAPQMNNEKIVVDYVGIGSQGTLGLYFGLSRKF